MEVVGTIAVVLSVLVLAYQGRELAKATEIANEVAATRTQRDLLSHWKSIIDVFMEYPQLHAYYYGTAPRPPDADDAVRLGVVAEQFADWLDTTLMTEQQLRSYLYRDRVGGWHDFVAKAIEQSPVLRSTIRSRPTEWPLLDPLVAGHDAAHPLLAPQTGADAAPEDDTIS